MTYKSPLENDEDLIKTRIHIVSVRNIINYSNICIFMYYIMRPK